MQEKKPFTEGKLGGGERIIHALFQPPRYLPE